MKTILLFFVAMFVAILFDINTLNATPAISIDSCYKMVLPNNYVFGKGGSHNPDSVLIDSCPASLTYGRLFAKRWFAISFPANFYPFNHQLASGEVKGVTDIDSAHLSFLNRFLGLQDTFGLIFFQGLQFPPSDSILMLGPSIRFYFDEYQDGEFIAEHFTNTIDSVRKVAFQMRAATPTGGGTDVNETVGADFISIYPNPVKEYITIKEEKAGVVRGVIEIVSLDGKKVLESEYKDTIDISMLQSGTYFLKTNNYSFKFIKE
ncbi:MAG: T9SS type A sorting domain-containing protein [Ignavibacteriae bacterium]|nr:T9SS type A sorting domain-containing protein [Ignavibacteriota bacterium]